MLVLEHRRTHNAHSLFDILRGIVPNDPCVGDVGGAGIPTDETTVNRFLQFYKSLYGGDSARAPLPGPQNKHWTQHLPTVNGDALGAPVSSEEILRILYPLGVEDKPSPSACPSGQPGCAICATEAAAFAGWDGDPDNTDAAPWQSPCFHTSTAAGPDGLAPEVLRFSRNRDAAFRRSERLEICDVIASIFNKWLSDGEIPASCCKFRSTALFKSGDPADPNDYRFLTIGSLLQKLWSLVMTRRFTHWAVAGGVLCDAQAAFIPQHGCEHHVFALTEAIRWNWKRERDVYALFIDLRKAYDMVRPDALYALLSRLGVPGNVLAVLKSRSDQRMSSLRVGSVDGDEVHMADGVGQGDPLSCILFNVFMEPLLRSLHNLRALKGITVGDTAPTMQATTKGEAAGVRFKALAFADDLVIPCNSAAELQLAVDETLRWCLDWGMEMGFKKTQAVHFPCPPSRGQRPKAGATPLPRVPPAALVGHWFGTPNPIAWVDSYRYLGFQLFFDLRIWGNRSGGLASGKLVGGMGFMDEVQQRVNLAFARTVQAHTLIRKSPPALSLQIFRTSVAGSVNYLMSLVEPTDKACKVLDALSLKVARSALRLDSRCPNAIAWAESRLLPCEAVMARERSRLLLSLSLSPLDSIAQRIFRRLASLYTPAKLPGRANAKALWSHRMLDLQHHYASLGTPPAATNSPSCRNLGTAHHSQCGCLLDGTSCTASSTSSRLDARSFADSPALPPATDVFSHYVDIKRAAGVHARGVGMHVAKAAAAKTSAKAYPLPAVQPSSADRPRPGPPAVHCQDLLLLHTCSPVCSGATGTRKTITPVSARGPSCSGAILALVTRQMPARDIHALGMLRQGRVGMFHYPLAPTSRLPPKPVRRKRTRPDGDAVADAAGRAAPGKPDSDSDAGFTRKARTPRPSKRRIAASAACGDADQPRPAADNSAFERWARIANSYDTMCPLCGTAPEDPYHVLVECPEAEVSRCRASVLKAAPDKLAAICGDLLRARSVPGSSREERERQSANASSVQAAIREAASTGTWDTPERRFLLFRLLAVLPFPASAVAPGHALAMLVGDVFDKATVKAHKLRPTANKWAGFAGTSVTRIFSAWNTSFEALAEPVNPECPPPPTDGL
jgi:hypothetical protein